MSPQTNVVRASNRGRVTGTSTDVCQLVPSPDWDPLCHLGSQTQRDAIRVTYISFNTTVGH